MSPKSFVFSSPNLPKAKARQLHKAFPFLSLSTAQEMTARALGYPSWFECAKRGTSGPPSLGDQEAGLDTRVVRYYQQANVLINYGVTPHDADRWVRAWGLMGDPRSRSSTRRPCFTNGIAPSTHLSAATSTKRPSSTNTVITRTPTATTSTTSTVQLA